MQNAQITRKCDIIIQKADRVFKHSEIITLVFA